MTTPTGAATCSAGVKPTLTFTTSLRELGDLRLHALGDAPRGLMPKCASTLSPLPEAPNVSIPIEASTQRAQPKRRRRLDRDLRHARAAAPRRGSRRSAASKSSQLGIETTRACTPFSASRSRAPSAVADLGAGRDEHDVGRVGVGEHVRAAAQARRRARASSGRSIGHVLAREHEADRARAVLEDRAPRLGRLVRVGRADHGQASGSRASRRGARPAGASGRPRRPPPSRG